MGNCQKTTRTFSVTVHGHVQIHSLCICRGWVRCSCMAERDSQRAAFNPRKPLGITGGSPMNQGQGNCKTRMQCSQKFNSSKGYIQIETGPLVNYLTCPLCKNLCREATSISVCLHTFCRDCIHQKLGKDKTSCCPVCMASLGSSPKETLRPDDKMCELIIQLFPSENSTKKEEKLRTLVTERNNHPDQKSSHGSFNNLSKVSMKQVDRDSIKQTCKGSNWQCMARHKEAASKIADINETLSNFPTFNMKSEVLWKKKRSVKRRARVSLFGQSLFGKTKENEKIESSNIMEQIPKFHSDGTEKSVGSRKQSDETSTAKELSNKSLRPVWFSLHACEDKFFLSSTPCRTGNELPPMPKLYLRVMDGSQPVSYINRYLVQKLNLKDESEVEVLCYNQPLIPDLTINDLLDMWVEANSGTERECINFREGNPDGKKFVMELRYRRNYKHRNIEWN